MGEGGVWTGVLMLFAVGLLLAGCSANPPDPRPVQSVSAAAEEMVVTPSQLRYEQPEQAKTVTVRAVGDRIYRTGYYSYDRHTWKSYQFLGSGEWTTGSANAQITLTADDFLEDRMYVRTYVCERNSGSWVCPGWQEQELAATLDYCGSDSCYLRGHCYERGSTHPDNRKLCLDGWTTPPSTPPPPDNNA